MRGVATAFDSPPLRPEPASHLRRNPHPQNMNITLDARLLSASQAGSDARPCVPKRQMLPTPPVPNSAAPDCEGAVRSSPTPVSKSFARLGEGWELGSKKLEGCSDGNRLSTPPTRTSTAPAKKPAPAKYKGHIYYVYTGKQTILAAEKTMKT